MKRESESADIIECLNCEFEAPANSGRWESAEHIAIGNIAKCPICDSTMTTDLGNV